MTKVNSKELKFGIIRHHNSPHKATLPNGQSVFRKETIYVPEFGGDIKCAPYEEHFVFEVPKNIKNCSSFMCTCGSPAVIAGISGYLNDASPQGKLFLCLFHSNYGHHAHSDNVRWI